MSLITVDISNYQHLKSMSSYDSQPNKCIPVENETQPEWQRNALRICGNWSEQLSRKGKVYFYNSVTEVSQWQKPEEWSLPEIDKEELAKVIEKKRDTGHKRSYNAPSTSIYVPTKVHRMDHDSDRYSSSGERKSRNGKPYDDMEISPHSSPQNRVREQRRSNELPLKQNPKPVYTQKQPTTLKKLVDVLESLDNLLTTKSLRNNMSNGNAGVSSCSPISSSNKSLTDNNRTVPPPPPPPKLPQKQVNNENTNGSSKNPKAVSALANTLNSLVSLLNQKSNNKRQSLSQKSSTSGGINSTNNLSQITPNSTPKSSREYHHQSNHHSSPYTAAKPNSNHQRTNHNGNLNSPNRLYSPINSLNNLNQNNVNQNNQSNIQRKSDGNYEDYGIQSTAASYRDHRLQKQRSANNNDPFNTNGKRESKLSESEKINNHPNSNHNDPNSLINKSTSNNVNGVISSNGDVSNRSITKFPDDIPNDVNDKRYKLFQQVSSVLYSPDALKYVDESLTDKFFDKQFTCITTEANSEAKKFDQLHNYLYCELSCEMKKLRSLLLFSEAKLNCHEKKRESLTKLIEELESRKPLANKSFYKNQTE